MSRKKGIRLKVSEEESGLRLDKLLKLRYPDWGRGAIKKLVNSKEIEVNGKKIWLGSWKLSEDDVIVIPRPPTVKKTLFQRFDQAWVISEDKDLIVVNKPSGLRSHASRAGGGDNLFDLAIEKFGQVTLFHRLDRDTSGIVLLTKTGEVNKYLDKVFKSGEVEKYYLAVTCAVQNIDPVGTITGRIGPHPYRSDMRSVVERGGQSAVTRYEVLAESDGKQLLKLKPVTGRMHQIRVHLKSIGASVNGDILYGDKRVKSNRMLLHAVKLVLPKSDEFQKKEYRCLPGDDFLSGLPDSFKTLITK